MPKAIQKQTKTPNKIEDCCYYRSGTVREQCAVCCCGDNHKRAFRSSSVAGWRVNFDGSNVTCACLVDRGSGKMPSGKWWMQHGTVLADRPVEHAAKRTDNITAASSWSAVRSSCWARHAAISRDF